MAKALEKLKSLLDEGEPVDMCPHGTSELMCDQCDTLNYYALCEKAGCSHKEGHKCGKADEVDRWRSALKPAVYGTSTAGDVNTPEQFAEAICSERVAMCNEVDRLKKREGDMPAGEIALRDEVERRKIAEAEMRAQRDYAQSCSLNDANEHRKAKENWVSLVQTNEKAGITFDGDVDHLKRDELDPVADSKQGTLYVKMPFQKIVCKNCVYWETMGTHGLCRRYAPKETKIPWPTTVATDWCGEGRE